MTTTHALAEEALSALLSRRSVSPKRLEAPGPDAFAIDAMLRAALRAPDHGGLHPWRVIEFRAEHRETLADAFEQEKLRRDPLASPADLRRAREHALRPPVLLAFLVSPRPRTKVPLREQWLGAGAALGNLLNAAHQLGFGAIMLSGERCHDEALTRQIGVRGDEFLAGFVSMGTVRELPPQARTVLPGAVWTCWSPGMRRHVRQAPGIATIQEPALPAPARRPDAVSDTPYEVAVQAILAATQPITGEETLPLLWARGRVLAAPLRAPLDVPAHDNAAMDGFALRGQDLLSEGVTELEAVDATLRAGQVYEHGLLRGQCIEIMTGAPLPPGLDTVVPFELCDVMGCSVHIAPGRVRAGENVRLRGEDYRQGTTALQAGRRLRPADLGVAASLGRPALTVRRPLKVAILSCGDELTTPGDPLEAGRIYDSNRYGLMAALQDLGAEVQDLGRLPDDPQRLRDAVLCAADRVDVVISSGGVGEGAADFVGRFLHEEGRVVVRHVAMRPGRPVTVGCLQRRDTGAPVWHFALPGNPVAAMVAFDVLVRGALLRMAGAQAVPRPSITARLEQPLKKRPGRTEFQRARVWQDDAGEWRVAALANQGSGVMRSMSEANALLVLAHDRDAVAAGEQVEVWPFQGLC